MELETLGDKVSDIFDANGRIEMKLQNIDDRVNKLYSKVNDWQIEIRDEIHDVYVTCDGIDSEVKNIEGYCSSINSNIDQLKD